MAVLNFPSDTNQSPYTENGITYKWDGEKWKASMTTSGGAFVVISEDPPENPSAGDLWYNSSEDSGRLFVYYVDDNTSEWVDASPAGGSGGASVHVGDTPPNTATEGDLWWNSSLGKLFVYYEDPSGDKAWVDATTGSGGGGGTSVHVGDTPPSSPSSGDLWWDSSTTTLFIYYVDDDSSQWVSASPGGGGSGGGGASVSVGQNPPAGPAEGDLWWDSSEDSGRLYVWYDDGNTQQWVETSPSGSGGGDTINVTSGGADAWVSFDGTNFTNVGGENLCQINDSLNVSKVVRAGEGVYAIVYSTAMPNADYAINATATGANTNITSASFKRSDSCRIGTSSSGGVATDSVEVCVAVFATDGNSGGYWMEDGGALKPTNSANNVEIGGGDITLNADGSAQFGGGIISGADPTNGANTGFQGKFSGVMRTCRASGNLIEGYLLGSTLATTQIDATGSATFAGILQAAADESKASNGYVKLPSGIIIQWGRHGSGSGSEVVNNFPIAFPNAPWTFTGSPDNQAVQLQMRIISNSQFGITAAVGTPGVRWIAIGY